MCMPERAKRIVISIVVPMYNEAEGVEVFYERTLRALEATGQDFEIVCVNDGSRDDTLGRLLALHQRDPRVKVVDFSRNFGKEIAMTAGLDFVAGDVVVPIDADLQDPPELLPQMIEKWREGFDVVYAQRLVREGEGLFKKATAHMFYRVIDRVSSVKIPRDTGDFRLMDRKVVEALKQLPESHRFMKGLFAWVGFRQTAIEYNREPRAVGTTKWNYWKLWNFAIEGITSFSFIPLQVATYLGVFVSLLSFGYGAFIVVRTLVSGNPVPGYPSLLVFILFLGGVQLLTLGILGEYVGRIYGETKRRPLYLIQNAYGFESQVEVGKSVSRIRSA